MINHAWKTDDEAMKELFRDKPETLESIRKNYLAPRSKKKEGVQDRDRGHWLRPPQTGSEQAPIAPQEAARVLGHERLQSLSKTPNAMVGTAVAACYCGISEKMFNERYIALGQHAVGKKINGRDLLTAMGSKGLTDLITLTGKQSARKRGNRNRRRWKMSFVSKIKAAGNPKT